VIRRALRVVAASGLLAMGGTARAEEPAALQRLQAREETLTQLARTSEQLARQQARAAYRLARRRQLGFMAEPQARLEDARALDLALFAVRRSAEETRVYHQELARTHDERQALSAAVARVPAPLAGETPHFSRPVRGAVVGQAGLRRDPVTGVEVRQDALQLLARMNDPVSAPAPGTVRRVEQQPQGGFAVVTEHAGGWSSVLSGLREVSVSVGDAVAADAPLGLAGRNLDGAVVVSLELWHGRSAVDPGPLVRHGR
jgi:murein DD-endopeptidase MepM/ murein hydrolase activator NlpD